MSKRRRFTSTLIRIGYIFPELHYGTFARNWWEPVSINLENTIVSATPYRLYMCVKCNLNSKDFIITVVKNNKNQQKPGFRCTCENMSSEIESYPSTAINSCYKKVFDTKTEYSGIAVMEDDHCFLEIYQDSKMIQQFIGLTPDDVWKKVGILKNFSGSYIFGITHESIQQLLNSENNKIVTCLPDEWHNYEKLTKVFDRHIKTRKLPNTTINWTHLFDDWYKRHSTIVIFPLVLSKIYPENYKFQDKELRAWRAMFKACGCSNVTPFSQIKSQIEFWSRAYNNSADMQILNNLYKSNLLLINNKPEPIPPSISLITNYNTLFWESFRNTININKRGHNGKIRILSVIALKFKYIDLQKELARKHARLYGPEAPPLDKPKRKVQCINNIQEKQFKIFFQDRENVTISSYQTDAKTGLPILYLPFVARLNNSTNLKYRDDLGGLCQICNDYGFTTFENLFNIIQSNSNNKTIMNTMFIQLDKLKRHLKRDFEEELAVGLDGKVIHDPCISHCLLFAFENISEDYQSKLTEAKEQLLYFLSHQARKFYLNAQFKAILSELDSNGAVIIADYKMRVLPQSARETKQDFFGKRGWTLHTILFFTKNTNSNELNIEAYDHWSLDTKQDAWFTASAFEAVFETIEKKPKWIKIISDNGPHYHNSELMAIISHWYNWYNIEVRSWLFFEPGEAKTIIDSHHAAITHAIKRYLRIGYDISSGEDIVQAAKGLSGTSLANLEPNRNNEIEDVHELDKTNKPKNTRKKSKIKTIKGISNFFYWEWPSNLAINRNPIHDKTVLFFSIRPVYEGYIRARPLPHVGNWSNFSPSYIADLWNSPLYQPQPLISQCTIPETKWTIPITMESDSNENNININIEDIDTIENINKVEREIEDIIDLTGNNNDIKSIDSEFPLIKGWALKSNQKFGGKGGNRMKKEIKTLLECFFLNGNRNQKDKMNAQDMQTELLKYIEAGELAEDDIPKNTKALEMSKLRADITYNHQLQKKVLKITAQTIISEIELSKCYKTEQIITDENNEDEQTDEQDDEEIPIYESQNSFNSEKINKEIEITNIEENNNLEDDFGNYLQE
ncbi:hypothetical protein Glove_510g27 [Diversispora epigaea]|uniref:Uncharacterized protein n=1 Tax=Diversispora epigaea TaxID=1348612 RepID=A0A397GI81_9GLOM|nr:hypothetical protein Glove_510g27 [Diversispora epigaea]